MSEQGPSRREALKLGAVAAVAAGCGKDAIDSGAAPAEPMPAAPSTDWTPEGALDAALFPMGVQVGDPEADRATCWTRYDGDGDVTLVVVGWDGADWVEVLRADATPADGGFVHVEATGLIAGAWHRFVFLADGARSEVGRWLAPPLGGLFAVTFGGSSCTSRSYMPFSSLSHAAGEELAFFLLAGDTIYGDSATTSEAYRTIWYETLADAGYRALLPTVATIATWDDHEVSNNWGTEYYSDDRIQTGMKAFFEHMPVSVSYGDSIYRRLRWGDTLEIFVLDCRSERDPAAGLYLSTAQMDWLIDAVTGSTAVFKFILNSVAMLDYDSLIGDLEADDRWQGYPEQRQQLIDGLAGVANVYFLSGDFHLGQISRCDPDGPGAEMFDVLMGPGGNFLNPIGIAEPGDQHLLFVSDWNYTRFTADPVAETLYVEFVGNDGSVLGDMLLPV